MNIDRMTAVMQFILTVIYLLGYFGLVAIVIFGRATLPGEQIELAKLLVVALTTILPQITAYWFARQRNAVAEPQQ